MRAMRYLDPETRLSKHFRLREFTRSDTADEHGIEVRVEAESSVHRCLIALIGRVLEPLRREIDRPVRVTSGYRPSELNELVGGVEDSDHTDGKAADVDVEGMTPLELAETVERLELPVDQCIQEFDRWVHLSYSTRQRREYLTAYTDAEGNTRYAEGLHEASALAQEADDE